MNLEQSKCIHEGDSIFITNDMVIEFMKSKNNCDIVPMRVNCNCDTEESNLYKFICAVDSDGNYRYIDSESDYEENDNPIFLQIHLYCCPECGAWEVYLAD